MTFVKNNIDLFRKWIGLNKFIFVVLLGIFALGFILRITTLENNLLFGMEQGRDALKAADIYSLRDIVLIGPKTDIDGIFHGVWYYYLAAFLYFIFQGNPLSVVYSLAALNILSIFVVYAISRNLGISKAISVFSAALFAASFNLVAYARWLSNVSPSIFVVSCFILSSILLIKYKKDIYWIPTFVFFGLLFHFELLHGLYAMFILAIFGAAYKLPLFTKNFWKGFGLFVIINIPFLVFDIKNNFILSKGILYYLTNQNLSPNPAVAVGTYFKGLLEELTSTFYTKLATLPFVIFFILLFKIFTSEKLKTKHEVQAILLFALWSLPYVFLLKYDPLHQFYAGTSVALIVIFSYGINLISSHLNKYFLYGFMSLLVLGMMQGSYKNISERNNIFYHTVQKEMTYLDQRNVIKSMFESGKPFEWEAFTIPYYYSDAYRYLIPWYGRQLVGNESEKMLSTPEKSAYYLIVEPSTEGYWLTKWIEEKEAVSTKEDEKVFGSIKLEIRKKIK